MSEWSVVFLGVMAVSLAIMAAVQIGVIIIGIRAAKQMSVAMDALRREIKPLSDKVHRIADEVERTASLAALQVERVDQMMATTASRLDSTLGILQGFAGGPVKQGTAAVAAFRAAWSVFSDWKNRDRRRSRHTREDDDALFVG